MVSTCVLLGDGRPSPLPLTAMATQRSERYHEIVLAEINAEKAAVLGRIARRLERARNRSEELGAAIDRAVRLDPGVLDEHRRAHAEAEHWRWMLCVQREANGLYDHRWVDVMYPALRRR